MRFGRSNAGVPIESDPGLKIVSDRLASLENAVGAIAQTLSTMHANQSVALIDTLAATPRYADARRASCAQGQVFSQNNEDGIIAEIDSIRHAVAPVLQDGALTLVDQMIWFGNKTVG